MKNLWMLVLVCMISLFAYACDDDKKNEAVDLGVGAQCTETAQCDETTQECLLDFKGGYCGVKDCTGDVDCPEGSRCVAHDDGVNYCFLVCVDKADCNVSRDVDNEANCASSIDFVDEPQDSKACVPPSN